jgi:hypothetical protein
VRAFAELGFALPLLKAGFSPLWNPQLSCGTPLFAQPGLALGYPGILPCLLLPPKLGAALFLAAHAGLAFAGARRLLPPAVAGAWALAAAFLGARFQPSLAAAMAWLPWAMDLKGWASFGAWAFFFSCGDPLGLLLGALAACFRFRKRAFVLAALSSAAVIFPTLEALALTKSAEGGWPDLDPARERRIQVQAREFRVAPEGLPIPFFPGPSSLNWMGGSRRPVGDFFAGPGGGQRFILKNGGEEMLKAPLRVGMQCGSAWTLLQPSYNAMGEFELELPAGHQDCRLLVTNAFYPGWVAKLGGKSGKLEKAEGGFQALELKDSGTALKLQFRPMSWIFGMTLSLGALVFALLLLTSMREIPIISRFS